MKGTRFPVRRARLALVAALAALAGPAALISAAPEAANAAPGGNHSLFAPGDLLVTTGVWTSNADITAGTTQLPPNCATANPAYVTCGTAVAPGTYPLVFNNDASDGSFGVTQPIVLDEVDPSTGRLVKSVTVPDNPANGKAAACCVVSSASAVTTWTDSPAPSSSSRRSTARPAASGSSISPASVRTATAWSPPPATKAGMGAAPVDAALSRLVGGRTGAPHRSPA